MTNNIRIKICGLTCPEEAAFLNKNHVDFLGYESIFRHIIANGSYVAFVV